MLATAGFPSPYCLPYSSDLTPERRGLVRPPENEKRLLPRWIALPFGEGEPNLDQDQLQEAWTGVRWQCRRRLAASQSWTVLCLCVAKLSITRCRSWSGQANRS